MKYYFKVLNNYVTFKGRARRSEYWFFHLFNFIFYLIIYLALDEKISSLYLIATFLPGLALTVRRIQDTGRPWVFMLIPIYNLILTLQEGTKGNNEYGPDPKGTAESVKENEDDYYIVTSFLTSIFISLSCYALCDSLNLLDSSQAVTYACLIIPFIVSFVFLLSISLSKKAEVE